MTTKLLTARLDENLLDRFREKAKANDETMTTALKKLIESYLDENIDTNLDGEDSAKKHLDSNLDTNLDEKIDSKLDEKLAGYLDDNIDKHLDAKIDSKLDEKLDKKLETYLEGLSISIETLEESSIEQQNFTSPQKETPSETYPEPTEEREEGEFITKEGEPPQEAKEEEKEEEDAIAGTLPDTLSYPKLAEAYGISRNTLANWVNGSTIPRGKAKDGRVKRVVWEEIKDNWELGEDGRWHKR